MPADPIKVLLADDHTMFREGLAGLLASYGGMEVVGSAPNGEEAVALAQKSRPDVVLMQVQVPFEKARTHPASMTKSRPGRLKPGASRVAVPGERRRRRTRAVSRPR